jgi:hypothetical protein
MTTFPIAVLEVKQNGGMGFVEDYLQWCQDDAQPQPQNNFAKYLGSYRKLLNL